MTFLKSCLIISVIVACATLINGHGDGAPISTCDTMTVVHNNVDGAQPGTSSYMVMPTLPQVAAGGSLSVWVMSDDNTAIFEGLLLKAIDASQAETDFSGAAGSFAIAAADTALYHTLDCSGGVQSAVTHSSSVDKTDATFTWTAPEAAGTYVFAITIAQSHDVYWLPARSATIEVV